MQNKTTQIIELLDLIAKTNRDSETEKDIKVKKEFADRQSLENKKQRAEIDNLTQHTESLKEATALKKRFTRFVLIYLCLYTLVVVTPVWIFLFLNPQTPGIHYVLVTLIGSLTVGLFSCVRATANGIFGEKKGEIMNFHVSHLG